MGRMGRMNLARLIKAWQQSRTGPQVELRNIQYPLDVLGTEPIPHHSVSITIEVVSHAITPKPLELA